ncbi:MAG: OmpA family protein [Alphaproteobacteria bacterium]|nr:MAG: OmpA family protein [Alphaproteobacteria bacterium]
MNRLLAGSCVAALVLASACAPTNDGRPNRTVTGALIGSTVGALGGLLVGGNDRRNALMGAGIGVLVGAAIGNYLDQREAELRRELRGTGAIVTRYDDRLGVTLPEGITFDVDSARLKPRSRRVINRIARALNRDPRSYVDVIGHTDSTGTRAYNQQLSTRRARAVYNALIRRGVAAERLAFAGAGETQPIASNATAEGRARNRRVEIIIYPAS